MISKAATTIWTVKTCSLSCDLESLRLKFNGIQLNCILKVICSASINYTIIPQITNHGSLHYTIICSGESQISMPLLSCESRIRIRDPNKSSFGLMTYDKRLNSRLRMSRCQATVSKKLLDVGVCLATVKDTLHVHDDNICCCILNELMIS